jgi:predicted PurR-regulated permease PerM
VSIFTIASHYIFSLSDNQLNWFSSFVSVNRYQRVSVMRRSAYIQRLLLLGLSGPLLALNVWILAQVVSYFKQLITVLLISAILAFLLNYPVKILVRFYRSRSQAVIVVLLLTLTLLIVLGITVVPILINQTAELAKNIPAWLETSNTNLDHWHSWIRARNLPIDLKAFSNRVNANIESQVQVLATQVLNFALGTISGLVDTVLIFVLSFYMLLYGGSLWQGLISLLPSELGIPFSESLRLNFQNFFISQLLLGFFMFAVLTPIFLILKVPFALLFALLIGLAQLLPFIGAALGIGLVTILVMLNNFWLGIQVAVTALIIQQIKDNILAPKLMGEFIGLNPLLIFLAILLGAKIAGVLGVLIAVPVAGTIKGTIDAIRLQHQPSSLMTETAATTANPSVGREEPFSK